MGKSGRGVDDIKSMKCGISNECDMGYFVGGELDDFEANEMDGSKSQNIFGEI